MYRLGSVPSQRKTYIPLNELASRINIPSNASGGPFYMWNGLASWQDEAELEPFLADVPTEARSVLSAIETDQLLALLEGSRMLGEQDLSKTGAPDHAQILRAMPLPSAILLPTICRTTPLATRMVRFLSLYLA